MNVCVSLLRKGNISVLRLNARSYLVSLWTLEADCALWGRLKVGYQGDPEASTVMNIPACTLLYILTESPVGPGGPRGPGGPKGPWNSTKTKWRGGVYFQPVQRAWIIDNFTFFPDFLTFSAPHLLLGRAVPGFLAALGPPFLRCPPVGRSALSVHRDPAEIAQLQMKARLSSNNNANHQYTSICRHLISLLAVVSLQS